jgi:polysaccharide export outer membrane protein
MRAHLCGLAIAIAAVLPSLASGDPLPADAVGPGDVLSVSYFAGGTRQEEFVTTVTPQGLATCPLLGDVEVAGLAPSAAAERMRGRLAKDYFVEPQVLVKVESYAGRVFVGGEVRNPGALPMQPGLTVLQACVLAGGLTPYASAGHVKVFRQSQPAPHAIEIDLGRVQKGQRPDLPLQIGDRIEVPHRRF